MKRHKTWLWPILLFPLLAGTVRATPVPPSPAKDALDIQKVQQDIASEKLTEQKNGARDRQVEA